MKLKLPIILLYICLIFAACSKDEESQTGEAVKADPATFCLPEVKAGQLIVRLQHDSVSVSDLIRNSGIRVEKMERVFPPAGRFEERSRQAGLHLWYVIHYDESVPATRAATALAIDGIAIIEPVVPVKRSMKGTFRKLNNGQAMQATGRATFNDPYFPLQWNFNNTKQVNHAQVGADIRLPDAWEFSTGHPDVIVAVVDGGIDYTHEDLSGNMWVNTTELNGTANVDDDKNGYKDDVYGFNFVTGKGLETTLHGTHVAGIIAAVNHNNKGVSSIAGGNGSPGSGVRLMSCQIFVENEKEEKEATNFHVAAAIKYAADNGAVICQNSWGFDLGTVTSTPRLIKEAIAYFIEKAGTDEHGNQSGPMKGGLVVFAAGNDETAVSTFPASDNNVVSVAAIAPDYKKASYSNYGPTVNLLAPGGEIAYDPGEGRTGVLSTGSGWDGTQVTQNAYYFIEGTSMACPHVSGVAALLVSAYRGTPGLTPNRLKEMLYNSAYDIFIYNTTYKGLLGAGMLDAAQALRMGMPSPSKPKRPIKPNRPGFWSEVSKIAQ